MLLTTHALKTIGFREMADDEEVSASFRSLHVYEARGLVLEAGTVDRVEGCLFGSQYSVALSPSVNEACEALANDTWTDDEPAWAIEHKCSSPYAIVQVTLPGTHSCTKGHLKMEGTTTWTYDGFSEARKELRVRQQEVLPSLISAMACRFGSADCPVLFRPVGTEFFGIMADGREVRDMRFEMRAAGHVARHIAFDQAALALRDSAALAAKMNPKVARFLHLGFEEDDALKRFLYFFLAVEIEVHSVFGSIDHPAKIRQLLASESRLPASSVRLLEAHRKQWTNLKDRFVWCAIWAWIEISDADVEEFDRLKGIRDDIAHGSIAEPSGDAVAAAERLALRLQRLRA